MPTATLAIIPARSGSKGIPNKNLMPIAGRPLLAWTVAAAAEALGPENVVVSSDGDALLDLAASLGVGTHRRSAEASSDTASSESALLEALDDLRPQGHDPQRVLFLQCTSPCTQREDLLALLETQDRRGLDSAFTATPSHAFLWKAADNGLAVGVNHDPASRPRRQDREPEYRENGAAYVFTTEGFRRHRHRFFGKCGFSVMPAERSLEIDSPEDAMLVESLLLKQGKLSAASASAVDLAWCKAVVFDFDGVLTDNAVWVSEEGTESVRCDRGDGMGFELARKAGVRTLILSKETNRVVSARAAKLRCEVAQGVEDKPTVLSDWLAAAGLGWEDIAYVGNDLNDLECVRRARLGVAVADAYEPLKQAADLVLDRPGGYGAARELLDRVRASHQA